MNDAALVRTLGVTSLVLFCLAAPAAAQQPTFKSRVDLVTGHGTVPPTKTADIVWARLAAEDYVP